jgi:ATP-dependent helicase/nuclease subunit B
VPESPHTGLDPRERGMLVHRVLATVWSELRTRRALEARRESELEALLASAAERAIAEEKRRRPGTLSERFAAIERDRLVRLAKAWLDCDLRRGDFVVAGVEDKRAVTVGPLALQLRLDRVDETAAGERIVIDYKASKVSLGAMLRSRPDEPQLPLYVVAAEPGAAAAAFAQVCAERIGFVGLAREEGLLPRVPTPETADSRSGAEASWDKQVAFWRAELERLAGDFAAGRAEVDPKRRLLTCRNCDVHPLCRVYERMGTALVED